MSICIMPFQPKGTGVWSEFSPTCLRLCCWSFPRWSFWSCQEALKKNTSLGDSGPMEISQRVKHCFWNWSCFMSSKHLFIKVTPVSPKINMSPNRRPLTKEISSSNHQFLGDMLVFRGGTSFSKRVFECLWNLLAAPLNSKEFACSDLFFFGGKICPCFPEIFSKSHHQTWNKITL